MTQTSAQTGDQSVSDRAFEVKDRAADVGSTVQDKASDVAGTATDRAADVAETAKDQALEVAQEAQRQARVLLGEFRAELQQQTQAQRDRLVEMLREFQDELQNMADAGGRNGTATEVVRQVADRLGGIRSYLENGSNPLDDVRSFARRRPGTFLFLAATAGVLAGRATRGAAAAREQRSGGRHVVDVRDGYPASSYTTGYGSGYAGGPSTRYTTGASQGYAAGADTAAGSAGYATGDYATGDDASRDSAQTDPTGYPATDETAGYRDQYESAEGAPIFEVERTSDPNLAPTSGTLTSDQLTERDLGAADEPVAPEYRGRSVGGPGPNAPMGNPRSGTSPTYRTGTTETNEGSR
ncbi:MAG: hypothetical protein ACXV3S_00400 [Kineosporiaceae bacterium]